MLKFGGEKALTKQVHDEALKCPLGLDDVKVEVVPKIIDESLIIASSDSMCEPEEKLKSRLIEPKVASKKDFLEKVANNLYDLEAHGEPERPLKINFDLYQMEDY